MKYKVGDKVRVKGELSVRDGTGIAYAVKDMFKYRSKIMTIKGMRKTIAGDYTIYTLDDNGENWAWTEEMFEPAYADGGFCNGFIGGKMPTPEKPIPIEEQLGHTFKDSLDSAFDAWKRLGGETTIYFENGSFIKTIPKEDKPMKFTFSTTEGYRIDKSNNTKVPTITTHVSVGRYYGGKATCDKADYSERQGCLEAIANAILGGNFDREYEKAVKKNKADDKSKCTCKYCGQVFDTVEEREAHEAWHVERRKARHERYKLRKRAKEIAFEEAAKKMAEEIVNAEKGVK